MQLEDKSVVICTVLFKCQSVRLLNENTLYISTRIILQQSRTKHFIANQKKNTSYFNATSGLRVFFLPKSNAGFTLALRDIYYFFSDENQDCTVLQGYDRIQKLYSKLWVIFCSNS